MEYRLVPGFMPGSTGTRKQSENPRTAKAHWGEELKQTVDIRDSVSVNPLEGWPLYQGLGVEVEG